MNCWRVLQPHDKIFGINLLLVMHWHKFPCSFVNSFFVPCRMRGPAEKRFLTMRTNLLQHIPRSFLKFPRSIVRRSFPLLRRPKSTIIFFWTTCIVTCNRFSIILISIRSPPRVRWSWRRHDRRHPRGQIHHKSRFGCGTFFSWSLLSSFCHCSSASCKTEMVNIKQSQQVIPFITCEIPLWLRCLRVGFWCRCIWFGFWDPEKFDRTTNQEQLCESWKHVSLLDSCL